jgi:tRNA 2-selenouridine synthase
MDHDKSKIDIAGFIELAERIPVIDVRSPSEFIAGHIPGAHNIPLFNDEERAAVGTAYKREGRIKAILNGLKLMGPSIHSKLEQALKISVNGNGRLLLYCWRGGMRSEAMAWLFNLGDIETDILEGGYKSYRNHILEDLSLNRKMIVLGGLTGSGKTHILRYLKDAGEQVIDLERLARHKGSAFGSLGQEAQPSSEHFANILYEDLRHSDKDLPVWIEDESRNIGNVFMPEEFYLNMQKNPSIILLMDIKTRLPRLLEEYSGFSAEELTESVKKISRRLGGGRTKESIDAILRNDFSTAIEIALQYYDKTYLYGLKRKDGENIFYVETDTDDIKVNALKIIKAARSINW